MRTLDNIPAELDYALREAVRARVGQYGGAVASMRRDLDHDGDDCIYVEVEYTTPGTPFDPLNIVGLDGALRNVAYENGERGILYVRNHFPHNQRIVATRSVHWLGDAPRDRRS